MKYLFLIAWAIFNCTQAIESADVTDKRGNAIRSKFTSLEQALKKNQFNRPLVLESQETSSSLKGDIYAIVDYSLSKVSSEMNNPDHWCDVMLMHNNTKYCHATKNNSTDPPDSSASAPKTILRVHVGKKTQEELSGVARIDFNYDVVALAPEYFQIKLNAKEGPLGTSDYLILLEAIKIPNGKTFLHLTYTYSMNLAGRMAMATYLNTVGSNKVGFTPVDKKNNNRPSYIGGVRGLVERNTMRYYLAIDSFLGAVNAPTATAQLEKRLQSWFAAVEQYPRQLHEMDKAEYMAMKRAENARQQAVR